MHTHTCIHTFFDRQSTCFIQPGIVAPAAYSLYHLSTPHPPPTKTQKSKQAIIFLVGLSGYNQVMFEDASYNRMQESLELFSEVTK
jgi:hypothetical protein